ncbi:A-kinase anchor protein 13 isoform X2 [Cheilinus undulatus]|uniref:A-kinase anchor protein 13 isoform X2 n=1 Tax=Cheilinus undulatus TaxID=241271 RepID=UPI001BD5EDEB|nr:A-kinase anchor protein 13 isoform X2 [Cheilinus undulatus]
MKLNPQQAPLYGRCVITVQLSDEELAGDEEGVDYFLLFTGSTQRHLTSTLRSSHDTLQALCPAHDCCEMVLVTLCSASRGVPDAPEAPMPCLGLVASLAEQRFSFVQDLAFDMAQFLVSTAGREDGLDGALLLDECQIPLQECERLDESLALALHHLALPPGWSLLGNKLTNNTDLDPQETLLHFSARRGLYRVTHFLLQRSGAKEALRLANRQGHTPCAIAAQRGHDHLLKLLTEAETDLETDKGTENTQPVSTDARVFCHLPRLKTHTLTLKAHPGRDPPTLQRSVEQLLHLICHAHAKGVSVLELQFDSLHTAAECCDGLETETTCLQQLSATSECLNLTTEEICSVESSSSVDCEHGENGNEEKAWSLSLSSQKSEAHPREYGLGPPEDWVCLSSNIRKDYGKRRQRREQPGVSSQSLSLCEEARSEVDGESLTVGIQPPAVCGKQAEETDSEEAEIREGQEATEGEERSEQEVEDSTAVRREEETDSTDPITPSGGLKSSVMGQAASSEGSEASESSDSEMKECSVEGERLKEEGMKLSKEPCVGLFLDVQEAESEEFSDPLSAPGELPSPSLIDCGDVIEEPESALLIEGLHEGEPPPDINSLEQNQETAGWDYSTEQQWDSAPDTYCHSGNCTGTVSREEQDGQDIAEPSEYIIESTILPMYEPYNTAGCEIFSMEEARTDSSPKPSSEIIPNSEIIDLDSGRTQSVSSDDDGSFQSVASSTTELFQDSAGKDREDSTGSKMDEPNDSEPVESNECSQTVDTVAEADCSQSGTEPASQLSPDAQTMEALYSEQTGEESAPELSTEDLSGQRLSESGDDPTVDESETAGASDSGLNAGFEDVATEVNGPSSEEESDKSTLDPNTENSGDVGLAPQQSKQDNSDMTADENSPDFTMSPSQDVTSDSADNNASEEDTPPSDNEASSESETTDDPEIQDEVDGASSNHNSASQEAILSEQTVMGAKEEESASAEDSSTIHRDREASFHQPCNTLLSGSSQSSVSPSLPSRTSSAPSCPSTAHRDSGSDIEGFLNAETGFDSVFRKNDERVTGGDSTSEVSVSCSSTDDTASVGPSSSSPEESQGLECSWSPEEGARPGATVTAGLDSSGGGGGTGEAEEEAKDRVTEVPRRCCLLRNSIRSISPLRRHSWGPGKNNGGDTEMNQRSYSLEGLSGAQEELRGPNTQVPRILEPLRIPRQESDDRGSLVSLTEEQEELVEHTRLHDPKTRRYRPLRNSCSPMSLPLTKSVSMLAISQRDTDGMRSFSSASGSLAYSISEEEPGPLRSDTEGKNTTKVSRTFSYLKNKMYKKNREKEREKREKEKEKESKEKDKKSPSGHMFTVAISGLPAQCSQCNKAFNSKGGFRCASCNIFVHKGCRDSLPVCAKVKMKQFSLPDSSSFPTVTMRNKSGMTRERPRSAILSPEDHSSLMIPSSRRHTSIMHFPGNNLSKSLSISNIAGPVFDEMPIKGLRYLSQSTDSLNRTNQVTESMESLTDEGTEMMDVQLMGEFEAEAKELESDSWSLGVEPQYLQQLDKELVKRQDVIYELMQTEMHHIRTLRIMSEVYSKGLQKEVQLEVQTVERLLPALDELLDLHTQHLFRLLERKRESQLEGGSSEGGFIINRIGDILVSQFSGSNGESMKRVYGQFCCRHNEAVNFYKDLLTKDKRFKAFIKKKMSSSIVRRLGIPECILLVTQRITKYPVLIQRMLQHTKESEEDYYDLTEAVRLVKEVIAAVDSKVNEHDKRRRLKEFHLRMDSKSIMTRKSGQIFAREDLLRRRLIHDGGLQLKNIQGRLKDVHALLLSDVIVFLQEKDQKYVFAMLDQRSTVISLQKLIVREVANEERGLFLITAGIEKPEMMEVLASSKDERNTWMQLIQEAMQSMDKDEDEGIPSETEDDKRQLESKAKEMRDLLRQKDTEIMSLLEEKVRLFRGMWEGLNQGEEVPQQVEPFFRSTSSQEPPRGASVLKDALQEVETLQALVNGSLGGAMASVQEGGSSGSVCLPRRAETFGGFDSHQMHSSKSGDRDESEDMAGDLRRTESDSVLKKGGNANLLLLLKRNSEQVLHSVSNLHLLLSTLQAVVVQQDSFIEDQRQALSERSSSCSSLSRPSSRPSSLIEQEKQRSLEKQRQELASLQRQQAAHAEEKRRRERELELRELQLMEREVLVHTQEEEVLKQHKELEEAKLELQSKKEEYQKDLERLRDAQRKLERDKEAMQRHLDKMEELRLMERSPSTTLDDPQFPASSQSLELDPLELSSSSSSSLPRLQPQKSKPKAKGLNPFTSSNANLKGSEGNNQISKSLLQLAKNKSKEGKEKKKKKGKGGSAQTADPQHLSEPPMDGEIFFC